MIDRRYPEAVDLLRKADSVKPLQGEVVDALMQCLIKNNQGPEAEKVGLAFLRDNKILGSVYDTSVRILHDREPALRRGITC